MSWCKWLGLPQDDSIEELVDTLSWCNQAAASTNANASSGALINAASCGARFEHSVAAALLTFGAIHGPLTEARELLYRTGKSEIVDRLYGGEILPGWGNAFYKKSIDPAFVPIAHLVKGKYPEHQKRLDRIDKLIQQTRDKVLYPNAASYGAIVAEILGLAHGVEIILPIALRLPTWSKQFMEAKR